MRKAIETLGMDPSTAANRLRKMVLFRQLQKYGDNVCVRCGELIETAKDLSIEHIKPWEGVSAELFWDLENVAFSHRRCNVTHHNTGPAKRRKIGPEGTSWCRVHKQFLPVDRFYKDPSQWNGLNRRCIDCHNGRPREIEKLNLRVAHLVERQSEKLEKRVQVSS